MKELLLNTNKFIFPSAAGTYHTVCQPDNTLGSKLFTRFFEYNKTPKLQLSELQDITGVSDTNDFIEQINFMVSLGWFDEFDEPIELPKTTAMEIILPQLLETLSSTGHALLADDHGFCLASALFSEEESESLAVMSVKFPMIYNRHQTEIENSLPFPSRAWGMLDAAGHSYLGVWPIFLEYKKFYLLIKGLPKLNHSSFVTLVWLLYNRYVN